MNISVNSNTYTNTGTVNSGEAVRGSELSGRDVVLAKNVLNVKAGDVFSGQIVGMSDDGVVQLLLGGNATINAKLSQNINISLGQTLSFQVRNTGGNQVSITPLFENLDGNSAEGRALDAAGLARTAENIEMVDSMMENGMSIDAKSLQDMAKTVSQINSGSPSSVVSMKALGIPVTEENVAEFEIYKNNQHQIAESVDSIASGLSEITDGKVLSDALNVVMGNVPGETKAALNEALSKAAETAGEQGEVPAQEEIKAEGKPAGENAVIQKDGVILEQSSVSNEMAALADGRGAEVTDVKAHVTTDLKALLGEDGVKELKALMDKAGIPGELTEKVSKGEYTTKDALNLLRAASENDTLSNEMKGELTALLKSGPYKTLVKNEFANSFLMNPSDVADKEKVKDYYSKLSEDTQRLFQVLNGSADKNAVAAGKDVQNLKSNIDFMNDMNAALTYIQLPLKMADNSAHGDLYVYTNKKNLAKKDGNVSALLHLDMEHLGTMDIHVSMNAEKNVKTHFIMQREEMLGFIAAHLHELDEALNKRGYSMKSDVSLNREETSVPELMFKKGTNARLIQKTAFDVRA